MHNHIRPLIANHPRWIVARDIKRHKTHIVRQTLRQILRQSQVSRHNLMVLPRKFAKQRLPRQDPPRR